MELTTLVITAFLVGLSGAMMPGPLLTATVAASLTRGFVAGPLIVAGHAILELALITALFLGLSTTLQNPAVGKGIALVGGAFLLYLGYTMCRDVLSGRLSWNDAMPMDGIADRGMHPILTGIFISLANPYWIIWWATIGLGYLVMAQSYGLPGIAAFFAGHITADLVWYCAIAAAASGGKRFMGQQLYRGIIMICGIFLVILGGVFINTVI